MKKLIHAYLLTGALVAAGALAAMPGCGSDTAATDGATSADGSGGTAGAAGKAGSVGTTTGTGGAAGKAGSVGTTTGAGGSGKAGSSGTTTGAGGTTTGAGGTTAGAGGATTGAGGTTAGAGGGMAGGSGGSSALSCEAYCTTLMANCNTPDTKQYTDHDHCVASCQFYPVGLEADMAGNTLGCRTYHAGAAMADPTTHCPHAGPAGAGVCGDTCDGYCQLAMGACTGAYQVYDSASQCQTTCKSAGTTAPINIQTDAGNEVACLLYHAQEASVLPDQHCIGDLGPNSGTCK